MKITIIDPASSIFLNSVWSAFFHSIVLWLLKLSFPSPLLILNRQKQNFRGRRVSSMPPDYRLSLLLHKISNQISCIVERTENWFGKTTTYYFIECVWIFRNDLDKPENLKMIISSTILIWKCMKIIHRKY